MHTATTKPLFIAVIALLLPMTAAAQSDTADASEATGEASTQEDAGTDEGRELPPATDEEEDTSAASKEPDESDAPPAETPPADPPGETAEPPPASPVDTTSDTPPDDEPAAETATGETSEEVPSLDEMKDMSLDDLLDVVTFEAESEVVAATKEAVQASEAPSIVTVIPRSTILAHGYRSVGEALATVPGIHIIDDLITKNLGIRGIHSGPDSWSRSIKVLIDGQPVTFYSTGGSLLGFELIPIDAVEAIEVIRGPGSALYGANAFLGVVNIITRTPAGTGHFELSGEGGLVRGNPSYAGSLVASASAGEGSSTRVLAAVAGARLDRSGLSVAESSPDYATYAGLESANDLAKPTSVVLKGTWDARELGEIGLQYLHQRLDVRAAFSPHGILTARNRIAMANDILRGDYNRRFFDDMLQLRAWGSFTSGRTLPTEVLDTGAADFTISRRRRNTAFELGAEAGVSFSDHSVLVGVNYLSVDDSGDRIYQVARVSRDETRTQTGAPFSYEDIGVFAQAVVNPIDGLGITGGLRYSINDVWDNTLNGRVAVVYEILDNLSVKALWGNSYVPPAPSQLNGFPIRTNGLRGNPDLESQTANTVEGAVAFRYGEHLSLQANGFWTGIENRIESVSVGANVEARNLTRSNTYGVEGVAELIYAPFFVKANVSWQTTSIEEPEDAPYWWAIVYDVDGPGGDSPPSAPGVMGHLFAGVTLPEHHVQASLAAHVFGSRKATQQNIIENREAYELDGYWTLDLNLRTLNLRPLGDRLTEVSLHGTNLLDADYLEGGYLGVEIPALGRTVFLKLTQHF